MKKYTPQKKLAIGITSLSLLLTAAPSFAGSQGVDYYGSELKASVYQAPEQYVIVPSALAEAKKVEPEYDYIQNSDQSVSLYQAPEEHIIAPSALAEAKKVEFEYNATLDLEQSNSVYAAPEEHIIAPSALAEAKKVEFEYNATLDLEQSNSVYAAPEEHKIDPEILLASSLSSSLGNVSVEGLRLDESVALQQACEKISLCSVLTTEPNKDDKSYLLLNLAVSASQCLKDGGLSQGVLSEDKDNPQVWCLYSKEIVQK
ncbi:MAG: hypothetical protein IPJ69_14995 [Deltaproteobacteria bacterium]|nr:MAG: hypothetical protein IPJ69_14995 [Deltaproteobacteria bacterium]